MQLICVICCHLMTLFGHSLHAQSKSGISNFGFEMDGMEVRDSDFVDGLTQAKKRGIQVTKSGLPEFEPESSERKRTGRNRLSPQDFKTGQDLEKALAKVISVSQANQNIRAFLQKLAAEQGISIFLDRGIDPGQTITLKIDQKTVLQTLYLIADQLTAGSFGKPCAVIRIEETIYLGPRERASQFYFEFRNNRNQLKRISNRATRQNWMRRDELKWERLAQPRDLATAIVKENQIDLHGALDLPHDVWAQGKIAPTSVLGRLSLLAVGFRRAIEIDESGEKFKLIKAPFPTITQETYSLRSAPGLESQVKRIAKTAKTRKQGTSLRVTASPTDHYLIRRAIVLSQSSGASESIPLANKRVSLDTEGRIGSILTQVASQLKIKFEFDPELNEVLQKRIKISVKQVTYHELVEKALETTSLSFELNDKKLTVRKK